MTTLQITWPVEDADVSIADLKAEAASDLEQTLRMNRLRRTGNVQHEVLHGVPARIRATCPVKDPS